MSSETVKLKQLHWCFCEVIDVRNLQCMAKQFAKTNKTKASYMKNILSVAFNIPMKIFTLHEVMHVRTFEI